MKRFIIGFLMLIGLISGELYAVNSELKFYGNNEIKMEAGYKYDYGAESGIEIPWGFYNLTNLRLKKNILDWVSFSLAINLGINSGSFTDNYLYYLSDDLMAAYYRSLTFIGFTALERLQLTFDWDLFDVNIGCLRISRGFGYMFSPTDIFNPRNPANPGARPEGKVSILCNFWPGDAFRIQIFGIAPDNPFEKKGWGSKLGTAANFYLGDVNFEFLYSLMLPEIEYESDPAGAGLPPYTNNDFTHIAGFSLKLDLGIGLFMDSIYSFEQRVFKTDQYYGKKFKSYDLAEIAAGLDYTFDNSLYVLLEYMFYGSGMLDAEEEIGKIYENPLNIDWQETAPPERAAIMNPVLKPLPFLRHNYLYFSTQYPIGDTLGLNTGAVFGIDDLSCLFSLAIDIHDPLQKVNFNISGIYPLDKHLFSSGSRPGEFGPVQLGFHQKYNVTFKFKF